MKVAQLAGETRVDIRMDLQGHVDVKDFAGGLWILPDNTNRLGGDQDYSCRMTHEETSSNMLRLREDKKLPVGWMRQMSGAGGELE